MASIEPVFAVGPGSGSEFQASGALFRLGGTIRNRLLLGSLWGSLWQLDESVVCFFCVFVSVHTYDIQVLFKLFKCQIRSKISLSFVQAGENTGCCLCICRFDGFRFSREKNVGMQRFPS